MAGLWPPAAGVVTRPRSGLAGAGVSSSSSLAALQQPGDARCLLFYVPQRPVRAGRPSRIFAFFFFFFFFSDIVFSSACRQYLVSGTLRDQVTYPLTPGPSCDAAVLDCLRRVGLAKLASGAAAPRGLDTAHHDWADVLSGGEKQRVGLARLFFHKPRFAVLDESTSAINPDEEGALYRQLSELGITVFSIGARRCLSLHSNGFRFLTLRPVFSAPQRIGWSCASSTKRSCTLLATAPAGGR